MMPFQMSRLEYLTEILHNSINTCIKGKNENILTEKEVAFWRKTAKDGIFEILSLNTQNQQK